MISKVAIIPARLICAAIMKTTFSTCRPDGVVPDVRVRDRSLAAEGHGAHDWLRALQSWMLLPVQGQGSDGRQRDEEVHDQVGRGKTLRAV